MFILSNNLLINSKSKMYFSKNMFTEIEKINCKNSKDDKLLKKDAF